MIKSHRSWVTEAERRSRWKESCPLSCWFKTTPGAEWKMLELLFCWFLLERKRRRKEGERGRKEQEERREKKCALSICHVGWLRRTFSLQEPDWQVSRGAPGTWMGPPGGVHWCHFSDLPCFRILLLLQIPKSHEENVQIILSSF